MRAALTSITGNLLDLSALVEARCWEATDQQSHLLVTSCEQGFVLHQCGGKLLGGSGSAPIPGDRIEGATDHLSAGLLPQPSLISTLSDMYMYALRHANYLLTVSTSPLKSHINHPNVVEHPISLPPHREWVLRLPFPRRPVTDNSGLEGVLLIEKIFERDSTKRIPAMLSWHRENMWMPRLLCGTGLHPGV